MIQFLPEQESKIQEVILCPVCYTPLTESTRELAMERKRSEELPDRVLIWQFGVKDIDTTKQWLTSVGVTFREEWVTPREDWKYRVLHARTPNGYSLMLEGPGE
jgi:hypothetical protein